MNLKCDRLGKTAMIAAMTSQEEEDYLKANIKTICPGFRLAVTFISGLTSDVRKNRPVGHRVLASERDHRKDGRIRARRDARGAGGLSIISAATSRGRQPEDEVAIVTDENWVAVAIFGDSAIQP
jgi:hut operon positive regulator